MRSTSAKTLSDKNRQPYWEETTRRELEARNKILRSKMLGNRKE